MTQEDEKIKNDLISFEEEIAELFNAGKIMAPVHLSSNNEDQLIEIFKEIKREDWVFSTHRSHYHALLHGIDRDWLKSEILAGNSISICNPEKRFYASGIVGGSVPIALGVAMGIKRRGLDQRVWVFVGEMASRVGGFYEATNYAAGNSLPITFVVEDNDLSVNTPSSMAWGSSSEAGSNIIRYKYTRGKYPHYGSGKWVVFG